MDGEIIGEIEVPDELFRMHAFALRVSGDSMAPKLPDGRVAIFRPIHNGEAIPAKKPCCVWVETWTECVVKFFEKLPDGRILLSSVNQDPVYKIDPIDPNEKRVRVLGVIIKDEGYW